MADAKELPVYTSAKVKSVLFSRGKVRTTSYVGKGLPPAGTGYLAGQVRLPQPVLATVRILYRPAAGALGDGELVAQVITAADGTWRVDNLNTNLRYDVVCRKDGYNDEITASVQPLPV